MATKFKNLTNKPRTAKPMAMTNRPVSATKQTRNGGAASFKLKQSSAGVSGKTIKKATKSSATAPAGGGKFGSFIKQ